MPDGRAAMRRFWNWLRPTRLAVHYGEHGPVHVWRRSWRWTR